MQPVLALVFNEGCEGLVFNEGCEGRSGRTHAPPSRGYPSAVSLSDTALVTEIATNAIIFDRLSYLNNPVQNDGKKPVTC
jgi:hypothetical protein